MIKVFKEPVMNNNIVLISGKTSTGKSASLMGLADQPGVMYLNCENNKSLPFKNKMQTYNITDPLQIYEAFVHAEKDPNIHTIVIDTLTYLMDLFETMYVLTSANTQKAWGDYAQYFKKLMTEYVAKSTKRVIFLAHTSDVLNESEAVMETMVKVKGSLMAQGIESYFTTVVSTKKMPLRKLEAYKNPLLNISAEDELLGYKHVFQTRINKESVNERIRSHVGMWAINETFIDNSAQFLIERIAEYFN